MRKAIRGIKDKTKIYFENNEFDEVKKFDCRVCSFDNMFTVIPISPVTYREQYNRDICARVSVKVGLFHTHFEISDDWGMLHDVFIPNTMTDVITSAIKAAKDDRLLFDAEYPFHKRGFEGLNVKKIAISEIRGMIKIQYKHFDKQEWVQSTDVIPN